MHHDSVGDVYEPVHLCACAATSLIGAHDCLRNIQPALCSAAAFVPIRSSEHNPFSVIVLMWRSEQHVMETGWGETTRAKRQAAAALSIMRCL